MKDRKLQDKVNKILDGLPEIWDAGGVRNDVKLLDLAESGDEGLIELLLANPTTKAKFFALVGGALVFKSGEFRFFIEKNKIFNSFTKFKNRIGLSDGKKFIRDGGDVVLNFPFKDCVLAGGQSTEEGEDIYFESDKDGNYAQKKSKRAEVFFNEVLAHDEIDLLLKPKALVNWQRYTKNGVKAVGEIAHNSIGTIKENLIIKGNNLLALHSIKMQFAGKVKLIYIDPPYNTGGSAETFTYNNNFNHSTWLTFMKNRMEIAKDLLSDDGFIAIAIDHNELFYLGVLADEIFGREKRLGIISVVIKEGGRNLAKGFSVTNEFMLVYTKNNGTLRNVIIDESKEKEFDKEDENGKYKEQKFIRDFDPDATRETKPDRWYPIYVSEDLKDISLEKEGGYHEILPVSSTGREMVWNTKKETFRESYLAGEIYAKQEKGGIQIYKKVRENQVIKTHWAGSKYDAVSSGTKLLSKMLGRKSVSNPKSLYAVRDALHLMTSGDDIILDFFAGSGTTGHATLILNKKDGGNRQFILIEQLDEHIKVCQERVQKVMQQENIDDSFVYCELAEWNESAKQKIIACNDVAELCEFFAEMCQKYYLCYNVKVREFAEKIMHDDAFKKLPLAEQKAIFSVMLDNNRMYVCVGDVSDEEHSISAADQKLTEQFYSKE